MFLKKVEIFNVLGVQSATLSFYNDAPIYIVQCDSTCPILSSFAMAVQLIFSTKYAHIESLNRIQDIYEGYVRITFVVSGRNFVPDLDPHKSYEFDNIPCSSREAHKIKISHKSKSVEEKAKYEIVACRNFQRNASNIEFRIDNGARQICSPAAFHGKFRTNVDFIFPEIEELYSLQRGNLLNLLIKTLNSKWNQDMQLYEYYITFFKTEENQFLQNLCTAFLNANNTKKRIGQLHIVKICHDIRKIFEFLTCDEFTVWFIMTYQGKHIDMEVGEELDFDGVETCVQLKNEKISRLIDWSKSDQTIKDLLCIALDLAVAYNYKRNIVFLQQMDAIKEYQAMEMSIMAHLHNQGNIGNTVNMINIIFSNILIHIGSKSNALYMDEYLKWIKINYLQRIIDACTAMEITAVIQYHGGIPFTPLNSNVIKCVNSDVLGEGWSMVVLNNETLNEENIINCLQQNLV